MTYKEIDEMIKTVDKNGDGKINYSEFRVILIFRSKSNGRFFGLNKLLRVERCILLSLL